MWCFSWKGGPFFLQDPFFFLYFSDFQRLIRVRSASMTNKKPSGRVGRHDCHKLGHVRWNCRKLQNKNRKIQSSNYKKSLHDASTSITTLVESDKTNTCFISSSSTWVIDYEAIDHITSNSSLFTTF